MGVFYADEDQQQVVKFEMTQGRYFSKEFPSDTTAIILNEAAVREFGFTDPIGQELLYNENGEGQKPYKIIGVIKNFNFESFKTDVRPLSVLYTPDANNLLIRYEGSPKEIVADG
jgi:putative ABC transport system permease protein